LKIKLKIKPYDLGWLAKPSTFLGVGKEIKMQKIIFKRSASPWLLFGGLLTMRRREGSVGKICTPTWEVFVDVLGPQMGCSSTFSVKNLQKPASKTCWKNCRKD
jgi:hypothetical protein